MKREKIALILAIVAGLLSVVLLKLYVSSHKPKTIRVMVARADIPGGTAFAEKLLVARDLPLDGLNVPEVLTEAEFLARGSAFQLHQAQVMIPRDTPILRSYFAIEEQTFAKTIPVGMRAVTVRVDEASGVAYAIEPGDRVDIILVHLEKGERDGARFQPKSEVLLQDVTVLRTGTGPRTSPMEPEAKVERQYSSVTLALSPADVQRLLEAQQVGGQATLALRNPADAAEPRREQPPK